MDLTTNQVAAQMFAANPKLTVDELCETPFFLSKFPDRFNMAKDRRRAAIGCLRHLYQVERTRRKHELVLQLNLNNLSIAMLNPNTSSTLGDFTQAIVDAHALECVPAMNRMPLFRFAYQIRAVQAAKLLVNYFDVDDLCTAMRELVLRYEHGLAKLGAVPDSYESLKDIMAKYTEGEEGELPALVSILRVVDSALKSRGVTHPDPMIARPHFHRREIPPSGGGVAV